MATVPHVTSGLGLRKFQADVFLLTRVYVIVRILVLWNEDSRCSRTFVPVCHTIVTWQETAVLRCIAVVTSNFSVCSFVMWDIEQFFSTVLRREGLRWTAVGAEKTCNRHSPGWRALTDTSSRISWYSLCPHHSSMLLLFVHDLLILALFKGVFSCLIYATSKWWDGFER